MEEVRKKMAKALEILRQDLVNLKVGRATPALVEQIQVDAGRKSYCNILLFVVIFHYHLVVNILSGFLTMYFAYTP